MLAQGVHLGRPLDRQDVVQRAHERQRELRARETPEVREPHAVEAAQDGRRDDDTPERRGHGRRRSELRELKLDQLRVRVHDRVVFRGDGRKRVVPRLGPGPRAEDGQIDVRRDARVVREESNLGSSPVALQQKPRVDVFPAPHVSFAHPVSLPRRAAVLERVVHRERVLFFLAVHPLRVKRVPVGKLRRRQRAHHDFTVETLEQTGPVAGFGGTRPAESHEVVERVLVPQIVFGFDQPHPLLRQRAAAASAPEPHHADVHRRVADVQLQALVVEA